MSCARGTGSNGSIGPEGRLHLPCACLGEQGGQVCTELVSRARMLPSAEEAAGSLQKWMQ